MYSDRSVGTFSFTDEGMEELAQKRLCLVDGVVYGFEIALLFNLRERVQIGFGKRRKREGRNVVQLGSRRTKISTMV